MKHAPKGLRNGATFLLAALLIIVGVASAATVLRQGDKGADVTRLQQKLKQYGYYTGAVDGVFGSGTRAAVVKFQTKYGVAADGIVGKQTAALLGLTLTGATNNTTASRGQASSDAYLLARLVHGEARGETYKGKVAVAAVVLNRVRHPSFPNTIAGVIYQPGGFTAVSDGQINLTPDAESLRAAQDAMNGWDPTNGCIYYYNPKTAQSAWIFSRKTVVVIGDHRFAV